MRNLQMQRADCIYCIMPYYVSKIPTFCCIYSSWNQSPSNTEGQLYPYVCMCIWCSRLPQWFSGKESACQGRRQSFNPCVGKIPWRRKQQLVSVFLPGKSNEQRSLWVSPWGLTRVRYYLATKQWCACVCIFRCLKRTGDTLFIQFYVTQWLGYMDLISSCTIHLLWDLEQVT